MGSIDPANGNEAVGEVEFEPVGFCPCGNVAYTWVSLLKPNGRMTVPVVICDECLEKYQKVFFGGAIKIGKYLRAV